MQTIRPEGVRPVAGAPEGCRPSVSQLTEQDKRIRLTLVGPLAASRRTATSTIDPIEAAWSSWNRRNSALEELDQHGFALVVHPQRPPIVFRIRINRLTRSDGILDDDEGGAHPSMTRPPLRPAQMRHGKSA